VRISLMGLSVSHYEALHDTLGDIVASTAMLGLTVGISLWGVKGDAVSWN
jgi:hypothetical protein